MKKRNISILISVVLICSIFLFNVSFASAGDDFKEHCSYSGCYISSCGNSASDISYIFADSCIPTYYCEENIAKQKVISDSTDGMINECKDAVQSQCVHNLENCADSGKTCENAVCIGCEYSDVIVSGEAVSIGAWVKSNRNDVYQGIGGKTYADIPTYNKMGFTLGKSSNNKFSFTFGDGGSWKGVGSNDPYIDNNWHYVLGVHDGTKAILYVDGVKQTTTTNGEIRDIKTIMDIGRLYSNYDDFYWDGLIDEFKIWNRALSDSEVMNLFNEQEVSAGLKAYYAFEENFLDGSGNRNHGVNNGAEFVDGKIGKAASFSPKDYISVYKDHCQITECNDGVDNDEDQLTDLDDSDCVDEYDPLEETTQCNDGHDNDGDNKYDYCMADGSNSDTCDPTCVDANDFLEGTTQCNDGVDNDGDQLTDLEDSDCVDGNDGTEGTDQCKDSYDNDLDTTCDLTTSTCSQTGVTPGDTECIDEDDPLEGTTQCNDEVDNDLDEDIDLDDTDCVDGNDVLEGTTQCNDGVDNDGDGYIDELDSDCIDGNDVLEGTTQCNDEVDNDRDGYADEEDSDCIDGNDGTEGTYTIAEITGAHWRSIKDLEITNADLADSVKLIVIGEGFAGKIIEFKVYKEIALWWDEEMDSQTSTAGFVIWDAGKNEGTEEFSSGNYYFEATVDSGEKFTSDTLSVSDTQLNDNPEVEILGPKNKQIYFKDEELLFKARTSDEDNLVLTWKWDLGEAGEIRTGTINSGELIEFNYAYPTGGQKNPILTISDGRGGIGRDQISLIAIASKYIMSYIDSPLHGVVINEGNVDFDASGVYAVEETKDENNVRTINCLKGVCPEYTEGCPPELVGTQAGKDSCPADDENKCCLNIIGDPVETQLDPVYTDIEFNWDFYENTQNGPVLIESSFVLGIPTTEYLFPRASSYVAKLTTSINPSSSTSTYFILDFIPPEPEIPICKNIVDSNQVNQLVDEGIDAEIGQTYWKVGGNHFRADDLRLGSPFYNCYQEDGVGNDNEDDGDLDNTCCPGDSICNPESGACEFNQQPELGCAQFDESNCGGNSNVAISQISNHDAMDVTCWTTEDIADTPSCTKYNECYCDWVEGENGDGICTANWQEKTTLGCGGDQDLGKCTIKHVRSEGGCNPGDPGYIVTSWVGEWNLAESSRPLDCPPEGTTTFTCEDAARLNFFGMFNLIIAILSIIAVYGIILRKEN